MVSKGIQRIFLFLYVGLVAVLSLIPVTDPGLPEDSDKVIHVLMYIPLGFLLNSSGVSPFRRGRFWFLLVVGTLTGAIIELLQGLTPGRSPSCADGASNLLGVAVGLGLGRFAEKRQPD